MDVLMRNNATCDLRIISTKVNKYLEAFQQGMENVTLKFKDEFRREICFPKATERIKKNPKKTQKNKDV